MLTTQHPMLIFWGPDHLCFYNDAFARSLGPEKDPAGLGAPAKVMWRETWDEITGPQIQHVMSGRGATWHENQLVPIDRHGVRDEVYWTYSFNPINHPEAPTGVGGVLVICTETTHQVKSEQHERAESARAHVNLKETHHRVKNNLMTIMAIVGLERRKLDNPELRQSLDRIRARLDSFAQLYEMMLVADDEDAVDAGQYIRRLCEKLSEITMSGSTTKVDCRVQTISVYLNQDDAISLGAIAVELTSNAVTHAFQDRNSGVIDVRLLRDGDDFSLIICDDGIGDNDRAHEQSSSSTGIGMELVKHYAQSLDGSLTTEASESGTTVTLRFPASREVAAT